MAQRPRVKQIISLHFSVDYAYLYILYTSHFKQLSLPFSVDYAYLYILYTSNFKQLLYFVDCKLWVSLFLCYQVIACDHSTTATVKCLWTIIAYDHSTSATEMCLWTHPFENRTKLNPFVSRGSDLYRAPQGKIECNDCVTWVSWPSLLGQNRIYTNNVIWVALNLIVYDHSLRRLKSVWECIPSKTELDRVPLFREGPIYIEPRRVK